MECLPSIVTHCLVCPSAGMSLSSVPKDSAFRGKLHSQKERITSISTCTSQPARTAAHCRALPERSQRAEQPCSEGRFYHCQERQEFLLLSTSLQACWFSVTDFSEIVRVFPDVENLKLCVRWTNRMYSLLLLLCLVTSLHLK